jgi:hypothetical protein
MSTTDYYVKMGADHSICQDYGLAGATKNGAAWAAISDGCSAVPDPRNPKYPPGYPFTDYGSRFLVRGAVLELQAAEENDDQFNHWHAFNFADLASRQLELPPDALNATLVLAYERGDMIFADMFGDGVILTLTKEDVLAYTTVEFDRNAPYYLSYVREDGNRQVYHQICKSLTLTHRRRVDGVWQDPLIEMTPISGWGLDPEARVYPKDTYKLVAVCSDGLGSFRDAKGGVVSLEDVLDKMCTFKGFQGEFLNRRMNFFQKACRELGWSHLDDLSIAGIALP